MKVLYILGAGRSGSTLLGNLLNEVESFHHVGELRHFWRLWSLVERRCGCGLSLAECPVWSRVALAPGVAEIDPRRMEALQSLIVRAGGMHSVLGRRRTARPEFPEWAEGTAALYRAVAGVTAARVIIDSSKRPQNGAVLRALPGIQPYYVHLVRDARAVAYSWQRTKVVPDRATPVETPTWGPVRATFDWMKQTMLAELVVRNERSSRSLRLRYEDLVASPRESLARIASLVGEGGSRLPLTTGDVVHLGGNHTLAGNPIRFESGTVRVRIDDEWQRRLRGVDRTAVTLLAMPGILRFGYPLMSSAATEARSDGSSPA